MKSILVLTLYIWSTAQKTAKYKQKKIKIDYEYLPQGYKDPETVICQKTATSSGGGGGGGGGTSVWGYLTAGVVAANVVANLANNVNSNNNNNNNNNNLDNSNNNNMNIGNSANSNMNMNIIIPIPGGRSFKKDSASVKKLLHPIFCLTFAQNVKVKTISDLSVQVTNIALNLIVSHMFQNIFTTDQLLSYSLNLFTCKSSEIL